MKELTPTTLRIVLIAALLLLAALGTGLFMVGYGQVKDYAADAQKTAAEASASNSSLQDLIATKQELEQDSDTVNRAAQIVAQSQSYKYQDQIITDIARFTSEAGLSVTNISFTDTKTTSVPATTGTAAGTTTPEGGVVGAAPAGVKSVTATVTLKNPVEYEKMLNFIHLIEQSLFRMQISQISLSRSTDANNPNLVSSDVLTIEVFIR